jgi:hypothetical protein
MSVKTKWLSYILVAIRYLVWLAIYEAWIEINENKIKTLQLPMLRKKQ